jgi:hypothetical protein
MESTKVVFPWSTCAMMAMLRKSSLAFFPAAPAAVSGSAIADLIVAEPLFVVVVVVLDIVARFARNDVALAAIIALAENAWCRALLLLMIDRLTF